MTLYKYLYVNANPVVYTDPTRYFSLMETEIGQTLEGILQSSYPTCFHKVMKMVNVASTCYSTTRRAVTSLLEGDSALFVMSGWITEIAFGAIIGVVMGMACNVPKALITAISVLASILLAPQMIEDWENGDYDLAVAGGLQMLSSLSTIFMKCFTGDTLVATEDGNKRIDEIAVGDYVWAEDTVTGEKVLKEVVKVYVKETDHLVHIGTSTGEDIETTENHPFYVDRRGWVAASEVKEGEQLHTEDGSVIIVTYNQDEWLKEPVKVYNLEVEGLHTYYVTADRVLVHNAYSAGDETPGGRKFTQHGAERANERGYSGEDIDDILDSWTNSYPQENRKTAYVKSQTYGHDVVVMDEDGETVVSVIGGNARKGYVNTLRTIKDVMKMIKKYMNQ